jgi:NitT/TauT family transport system permease protein
MTTSEARFTGTRTAQARALPLVVTAGAVVVWTLLSVFRVFPESMFPSPQSVATGFAEELSSGRLVTDLVASLFRVGVGFTLAVAAGLPLGLWLGHAARARAALLPVVNFLRNLSPIAWIPFAILWFGVGDVPVIFLIFLASVFPLVLASLAAVAGIPSVYFRVASDYGIAGRDLLAEVTLPAIMPQVITALRVTAGVSWVVLVAAEMIAGRDGLGFAILDARNGLRTDLVVVGMIVIGSIGVVIDKLLVRMTTIPSVRWGYER